VAKRAYARRYAQAVFEIAREAKELDRWRADLSQVARLAEDASVLAVLENPKLHFDLKARMLSGALGDISHLALNLVYLLIARGRLGMVGDISDEYQRLLDSHRGIEPAEVATAVPLDDEDKKRLGDRLSAIVGKKVVLKTDVDPGLVGGITAHVGGKLLDGSTRSRLEALKRELVRGGK
jgi:F-type H+-transporting ATPase subunit delta